MVDFFFVSREGRDGVKVPGHVANQRCSLCGTKEITVTWLATHGDANAVRVA